MHPDPAQPDEPTTEPTLPEPGAGGEELIPFGAPLEAGDPDDIPLVVPLSFPVRRRPKAQPHFWWAILWNLGFAAVLFGTIIGIVMVAAFVMAATGKAKDIQGDGTNIPRPLADVLAIGFPFGYLAGLGFSLIALRVVVGRDWPRQIGLHRPPLLHVVLVILGLPAFIMASEGVARLLIGLFGAGDGANQEQMLKDLFLPFPWWFAVLSIGICPGLVEELWCRGFLGRGLVGRYGWPLGILLTSLMFGLLHMFPPWYVLVTATMGIGLHLVYLASRSLWVPILLHTMNNSLSALGAIGAISLERPERNASDAPALVVILGTGLLIFVGVAMATGRVRLVPADPSAPIWEPPFPGVAHPPPGANAVQQTSPVSRVAVAFALVSFAALLFLLFR